MMNIDELKNFSKDIQGKILFDYNLKKTNWFNIGGIASVYFKPESLNELISFLKRFGSKEKIFLLGAGSNVLINDGVFKGIVIKLGKKFSNISQLSDSTLVAGSAATDKQVSEFACESNLSGFEFLSCIPGTIGGGLRMNSRISYYQYKLLIIQVKYSLYHLLE